METPCNYIALVVYIRPPHLSFHSTRTTFLILCLIFLPYQRLLSSIKCAFTQSCNQQIITRAFRFPFARIWLSIKVQRVGPGLAPLSTPSLCQAHQHSDRFTGFYKSQADYGNKSSDDSYQHHNLTNIEGLCLQSAPHITGHKLSNRT